MIAIDLDGTLLCSSGRVSRENAEAIRAARQAGVVVTVCTGRGLVECLPYLEQIGQEGAVAVAGGAMLACPVTRRTLHGFVMDPGLVERIVGVMLGHGHAALVLKDSHITGYDYLIVAPEGEGQVDPVSRWWFRTHDVPVRYVHRLDEDEHPEATVRVGVCGTRAATMNARNDIERGFTDLVTFHHFAGITPRRLDEDVALEADDPDKQIVILEAFDKSVCKWTAIRELARREQIETSRIATIGNDYNDLTMLKQAALGVAVGNAIPEALEAAHVRTLCNDEHGVAHAVERILAGDW